MSSNDEVTEGQVAMEAPIVFPPFSCAYHPLLSSSALGKMFETVLIFLDLFLSVPRYFATSDMKMYSSSGLIFH